MDGTGKMANSIEASCDQLDSSAENKSPSTYGSDCLRGIMNVRTSIAILTFSWHQFDDFSGGKHLDFCSFVVTNVAYVHCILQTLTLSSTTVATSGYSSFYSSAFIFFTTFTEHREPVDPKIVTSFTKIADFFDGSVRSRKH